MKIAITGGIGSGKSYVCRMLERRGIRVYDSDAAAKRLMNTDPELQSRLQALVGVGVYQDDRLCKSVLAQYIIESEIHKQAVNAIVHPAVARDFLQSGYTWLESAILFESAFDKRIRFDFIIGVMAPIDIRIKRIMHRDGITREQALSWIDLQMPQEQVADRCHFIINNDEKKDLDEQITRLIQIIQNQ